MKEVFTYEDAVITINAGVFHPATIDVQCGSFHASGLTAAAFLQLVYPALETQAKTANVPTLKESTSVSQEETAT